MLQSPAGVEGQSKDPVNSITAFVQRLSVALRLSLRHTAESRTIQHLWPFTGQEFLCRRAERFAARSFRSNAVFLYLVA